MERYGTHSSRLPLSEQCLPDDSPLMSNSVPLGKASQSTKLRTYSPTNNRFTAISSHQSGPEYSERLEPTQLDTNLIAEMLIQNMSSIDPVAASLNAPIHQEMLLFQAMSAYDATTIDDPTLYREIMLEEVLLCEPAVPDTPIRQDHVVYSALRSPPHTQDNRTSETISMVNGSGSKSRSLGDASGSNIANLYVLPISSIAKFYSPFTKTARPRRT